ncbi:TetR/AcrR family transcriptional regulator [Amorphus orientalis]|uniref:AcrR family transcriptional regulator n=1 Tax=Amorphus orientalis TaxID=649198 RepID=A0AAE4AQ97_9HYPH|nr:TetR/AcrR family transcriptional regulator [Amorphus orientalis]MDQ0313781.1 AcrR family transcriptional regulator [Amorphus orientalis]
MGRKRTIDRDSVLDAAECIVRRDGTARLTLDAVACEAGISKASVIYDYKTKAALMQAIVERRIAAEDARLETIREALASCPDATIRTHIAAAAGEYAEEEAEIALCLSAAMAQNPALREPIHKKYADYLDQIRAESQHPRGALLAYLALGGLRMMEKFGVYRFSSDERSQLLQEIGWLVDQDPQQVPIKNPETTE